MKSIGSRLKFERKRLNFTKEKIAAITGMSARAWYAYENDVRSPSANTLAAFCKAGANAEFILIGPKTPIKQALIDTGFINPNN